MDDRTERMYELMRKESNRLKTFQMYPPWPKDYVDIKKLAKAGFFYAFNGDNVHCAFCRGQVCRWDRVDDPMTEHSRHFTTCPFIMGGEVGNEPIGEDPIPGPKRPRPYDVCGAYSNFPPNDPRAEEEQQDFTSNSNDHYHQSQQQVQLSQTTQTLPEPQLNSTNMFASTNIQPLAPVDPVTPMSAIEPRGQLNDRDNTRDLIYHHLRNQDYSSLQPQLSNILSTHNNSSQDQNNDSPSSNLNGICKICYTNSIVLVFLPCGHSVSCLSCAQRLHDCPFCRETITTRIRTYLV